MDPLELVELARRDAELTHAHPTCRDASAVFAAAIARAVATGMDGRALYEFAVRLAEAGRFDDDVRRCLDGAARGNAEDFGRETGTVCITLQNAFYQLLNAASVEAGMVDTVMRGWDTDTNAAVAGALLGAVYGEAAIPARWREAVLACRPEAGRGAVEHPRPREYWPVDVPVLADELVRIGAACAGRSGTTGGGNASVAPAGPDQ
jgi:ADP-ribosylglycohydrolase